MTRHLPAIVLKRPEQQGKNYYGIDGLRGLAAIAVLFYHYMFFIAHEEGAAEWARFAPYRTAHWLFDQGGHAVLLFFTISGFIFLHIYGTKDKPPTGWTFFVNRFSRLYPLHFITLLAVAAIQAVSLATVGHYTWFENNGVYEFILHLFFASEWGLGGGMSFNGPVWSLSVEVLAYAMFYLYIRLLPVNLISLASVLALSVVGYALTGFSNSIAMCAVYFFSGCLAYCLFSLLPKTAPIAVLTGGALVVAAAAVLGGAMEALSVPTTIWLPSLFALLLMSLAQAELLLGSSWFRPVSPLGDITYSTYLWHTPIQLVLVLMAGTGIISSALFLQEWFFFAFMAFVAAISFASFHYIERPAQRGLRHAMLTPAASRSRKAA